MNLIRPSAYWLDEIDREKILTRLEIAGRTAYKSEEKITEGSATKFVANILKRQHESVIEHISLSARIICDRGVSHEIVRHRLASYTQESTRYCNYSKDGVWFVVPHWLYREWTDSSEEFLIWKNAMQYCENSYLHALTYGWTPQQARCFLPNSLKTEIVMTANLREWRHFFKMRCDKAAHPQMREIAFMLYNEIHRHLPEVFPEEYAY